MTICSQKNKFDIIKYCKEPARDAGRQRDPAPQADGAERSALMTAEKMEESQRILFVESQPERCDRIRAAFEHAGTAARLEFVSSPETAYEVLGRETVDAVFFDRTLCGIEGFEFLRGLRNGDGRDLAVIMITAPGDEKLALQALRDGVNDCVVWDSASIETFPAVAQRAIARCEAVRESSERASAILRSQKQWMFILDAMTDFIFVIDDGNRLLKVNTAFATAFGMHPNEMIGKPCSDLFDVDILNGELLQGIRRDGKPRAYERTIGRETYQISIFSLRENARSFTVHMMRNITELHQLRLRLRDIDPVVTSGLLVPSVIHEINNPLTGTIAYTELLAMKVSDADTKTDLDKILASAERCKKIVDVFADFSRQRPAHKSLGSLNELVDQVIVLCGYILRSRGIEVVRDYDPPATVLVDDQGMQRAILSILLNAEQAIAEADRDKGRIIITTRYNRENRTARISIEDNGAGISAQAALKIFLPFFTTRTGHTGLGLTLAREIVVEHGGTLSAGNASSGGAVFIIEFPVGT